MVAPFIFDKAPSESSFVKPSSMTSLGDDSTKTPSVVSFDEQSNIFEIPRVDLNKKQRRKLWISRKEIRHNTLMLRVRGMVQQKLFNLIAHNDDVMYVDTSHIEVVGDGDDDFDVEEQKLEDKDSREEILLSKKALIIQHLLEAIMDRPKDQIQSFLTSKATITFTTPNNE